MAGVGEARGRGGSASQRHLRYSQSLQRGLAVLGCFTAKQPLLGVAQIAQQLEMSRATAHRYLTTLTKLGYLEQDSSRKYRLGHGVADLGQAAMNAMGLPAHAHSHMARLARRTGHTVELSVLDGTEILIVDRIARTHSLEGGEADPRIGAHQPTHCTSAGKVLLAGLAQARLGRLLDRAPLQAHGPRAITDRAALEAELRRVRVDGFALAEEESAAGARAIAAPVHGEAGETLAALTLVGHDPLLDTEEMLERFGGLLLGTAELISRRLGWEDDPGGR